MNITLIKSGLSNTSVHITNTDKMKTNTNMGTKTCSGFPFFL